jgi:hypothetical protein
MNASREVTRVVGAKKQKAPKDDMDADTARSLPKAAGARSDDDAEGDWLFKKDDTVLGPVAVSTLLQQIADGDLDEDTEVARDGQPFSKMAGVPVFADACLLATRAAAKAAAVAAVATTRKRASILRGVLLVTLFASSFALAAVAARVIAVKRPWDDTASFLAKAPSLIDLPVKPVAVPPTPEKVVVADNAEKPAEPNDDPRERGSDRNDRRKKDRRDDKESGKKAEPEAPAAPTETKKDTKDDGPIPETLTTAQATAPLKSGGADFKKCFMTETESNPDCPAKVTLSYTVTEDGKATNVNLENRELKGRPVVECVRKAMAKLSWPRFSGERKNVTVPFTIGKPKPATPPPAK